MKALVLLNGCGHRDGSEVHEAAMTLLSLDQQGFTYQCASLKRPQNVVFDHLSGQELPLETRHMMEESGRIARGEVKDLSEISYEDFQLLVIPGGSGTAYNFCDFALKGSDMEVDELISQTIREFHAHKKPIGAICIAPVLVGKVLGEFKPKVTIGSDLGVANAINSWGANHQVCEKGQWYMDQQNKIVTTPAFMYGDSKLSEVWQGINGLVGGLKSFF